MLVWWVATAGADPGEDALARYLEARLAVVEGASPPGVPPRWSVVDGTGRALTAVELARRLGDPRAPALAGGQHRRAGIGVALLTAGLGGGVASIWFLGPTAPGYATLGGCAASLVAGGSLLGAAARHAPPSSSYGRADAEEAIRDYNAARRDELLGAPVPGPSAAPPEER